jgi:hypothetical protein
MATLVLSSLAASLTSASSTFVQLAAAVAAAAAGSFIDNKLFGPGPQRQEGPRLDNLQVQASSEGASIPEIAGRVRIAGQIIWATKFKEAAATEESGGKGIGGGSSSVSSTTYVYSCSFAIALCEGSIDRIGRIWADGKAMDLAGVTMRIYTGTDTQNPDPLIEGVEGAGNVPAYRGTAYVVFDNLALERYGNRIPQFTFEVFRSVKSNAGDGIENLVRAVTLIPGAGERVYDTQVQKRNLGGGATAPENDSMGRARADWNVALDDLKSSFPNCNTVLLVAGWFGDDLRCGSCTIRPKVEVADKITTPDAWHVHGLARSSAAVMSLHSGKPAYGGTPSDDSVVRAVRDLKARGYRVIIYPFLFMDIPAGNALPNPYGGASQPTYPWRGRVTCHPAAGQAGTVDKTAAAATQVASFFGTVAPSNIAISINPTTNAVTTTYTGPAEWTFRRHILHYAKLASAINAVDAGAVDGILIGSEMKALCSVRDSATNFPAVARMATLATDVKGIVGAGVKVAYASDWSDYSGYRPTDGTNDLFFHLDPLWASASIDFIGIDWYAPISDWRDGTGHLDATAGAASIYDQAYLRANVEGGEFYTWFYANDTDRANQVRTPITDGAHGKPWVFRAKDIRSWWLNQHFNRPGGVESGSPTAWVPQSKPIWMTEWGVPSVDKGSNQPNVFYDPKSSESFFPYFSQGNRDDLIQRRAIEALLQHWDANNPTSSVYGGQMLETIAVWTWDARPYPAWPGRTDQWSDSDLHPYGHWLNGKVGLADLGALIAERCRRIGFVDYDVSKIVGVVTGYLRDRPLSPRSEIEALASAYAFDSVETDGVIRFIPRGQKPVATIELSDLVTPGEGEEYSFTRAQETELPNEVSVTFTDAIDEYQAGAVSSRRTSGYSERKSDNRLPVVMDQVQAQSIADRALTEAWIGRETGRAALSPAHIAFDPGDVIELVVNGKARAFRITRINDQGWRECELVRTESAVYQPPLNGIAPPVVTTPAVFGAAVLRLLDLPLLNETDTGYSPYVAATSSPWGGVILQDSATGSDYRTDTDIGNRAVIGETLTALASGALDYWDTINTVDVRLYHGALSSVSDEAILAGTSNAMAFQTPAGWELVQFANATLIGASTYRLSRLLRGRLGTEWAMAASLPIGATCVLLDGAILEIDGRLSERSATRFYRYGPRSLSPTDPAWQQLTHAAKAAGLLPWAPVHVAGIRNGSGDLSITWTRRTRTGGIWSDGVDVPLNEESERYEVDIMNGGAVARTIAVTSPAASYPAAQQATDFGSAQASISLLVYQISASVGRGYAAAATV